MPPQGDLRERHPDGCSGLLEAGHALDVRGHREGVEGPQAGQPVARVGEVCRVARERCRVAHDVDDDARAQGRDLGQVATTMLLFGLGAATPLLVLGRVSRDMLLRWRTRMLSTGQGLKSALGVLLIAGGVLTLSGLDHTVEAALVDASPPWLTELTTRF